MSLSIIYKLKDSEIWEETVELYKQRSFADKTKMEFYTNTISQKLYVDAAESLIAGKYTFSIPQKKIINKTQSSKKKEIFVFSGMDELLMKVLNRVLMNDFSSLIAPNCHSFQRNKSALTAIRSILRRKKNAQLPSLKLDVSNYFNSIDTELFLQTLPAEMIKDTLLIHVLRAIYIKEKSTDMGQFGLMAGSPMAPFLSNFYLRMLDLHFYERGISYIRYSDDIILFDEQEELNKHQKFIQEFLTSRKLTVNLTKTRYYEANEPKEYLGFQFHANTVELAPITIEKLKAKIRRLSRSYLRKRYTKNWNEEKTIYLFIKRMNRKFFGIDNDKNELCWSRWYFPLLTKIDGLKVIDHYLQQQLRYVGTGNHGKLNFKKIPYSRLVELNYFPLVSAYYLFKENFEEFEQKTIKIIKNTGLTRNTTFVFPVYTQD